MTTEAVLFDAAETLFTTRGSVGEIYGLVAREYGCTAPFDEIQAAFLRQFRHSGPLSTSDEKAWWREVVHRVFAEVGMVRDNWSDDVIAAKRAGLRAVLIDRSNRFADIAIPRIQNLKELLLLV